MYYRNYFLVHSKWRTWVSDTGMFIIAQNHHHLVRIFLFIYLFYFIFLNIYWSLCSGFLTEYFCDVLSVGRYGEAQLDDGAANHPAFSPGLICSLITPDFTSWHKVEDNKVPESSSHTVKVICSETWKFRHSAWVMQHQWLCKCFW